MEMGPRGLWLLFLFYWWCLLLFAVEEMHYSMIQEIQTSTSRGTQWFCCHRCSSTSQSLQLTAQRLPQPANIFTYQTASATDMLRRTFQILCWANECLNWLLFEWLEINRGKQSLPRTQGRECGGLFWSFVPPVTLFFFFQNRLQGNELGLIIKPAILDFSNLHIDGSCVFAVNLCLELHNHNQSVSDRAKWSLL